MHAQITQNKKFVYLYNVYRKMLEMIFFLTADKHKSFLQVDSINLGVRSQACPKNPKYRVCNISTISQVKYEG